MNDQEIVDHMVKFIEQKENELQGNRYSADSQIKNKVVNLILEELERVTENEDK